LQRVKRGRGFSYLDEHDRRIEDPVVFRRLRQLAIPPAWREVWICSDPLGHLRKDHVTVHETALARRAYIDPRVFRKSPALGRETAPRNAA
jgi:DNA topoisomerase-1